MAGEIHFSSPGVWKWELHNSGKGGWWQRGGKGHHWTESPPMSLLETTHWCGSPGLSAPSMHLSATAHTSPLNAPQPYSPHLPPQCTSRLQPTPPPTLPWVPCACSCVSLQKCILANRKSTKITNHHNQERMSEKPQKPWSIVATFWITRGFQKPAWENVKNWVGIYA